MRVIWIALLGIAVLAGSAAGASKGGSVDLVAYSTPKDAYGKIISAFQKTQAGSGVDFSQSYGASGDQARAVAAGQHADLVALSLDPDVSMLVGKGLVPKNWNANAHRGIVSDSVVVFVVRDGNPKKIKGWGDLVKSGRPGDHAEPVHLGRRPLERDGRLRRAAPRGQDATSRRSRTCTSSSSTSPVQPDSARDGAADLRAGQGRRAAHLRERGDLRREEGRSHRVPHPKATLLIETPVALTKSGASKPAAKAFYKYLWSPRRRRHSRSRDTGPVVKSVAKGYHFFKPPGSSRSARRSSG